MMDAKNQCVNAPEVMRAGSVSSRQPDVLRIYGNNKEGKVPGF